MGWVRFVGSLEIYVSFAKEPYKRDDILRKRRTIWRGLDMVGTPYLRVLYARHMLQEEDISFFFLDLPREPAHCLICTMRWLFVL